jgi:hypothetical protein
MAIVGLVAAVPVTLLVRGGSSDRQTGTEENANGTPIPQKFRLHREAELPNLGVSVRVPGTWSVTRERSTIRLRSGDRTTELAVTAPAGANRKRTVLGSELGAIRRGYRDATVEAGSGRSVGGLPARGAVVSARTPSGTALRILVAVASGDQHTYVVELFSAASAPPERLIQAQLALRTLRLTG